MAVPGEKAIQMVRSAHAQATQMDIAVTAVVVDQSGRMIALGRMDRARPITVEIALNKAYTAASFQQPTRELAGVAGLSEIPACLPNALIDWTVRCTCGPASG